MENTAHHNSVYGETRRSQLTIFFNTKSQQGEEKSNIISKRKHKNTYTNHMLEQILTPTQTRWYKSDDFFITTNMNHQQKQRADCTGT